MLSAGWLQNNSETSIYKNAEMGKASAVAAAMETDLRMREAMNVDPAKTIKRARKELSK
jgi:hypothetical protein